MRIKIKKDAYHGWYFAWFNGKCWMGSCGPFWSGVRHILFKEVVR